jgi:hypothetical protein
MLDVSKAEWAEPAKAEVRRDKVSSNATPKVKRSTGSRTKDSVRATIGMENSIQRSANGATTFTARGGASRATATARNPWLTCGRALGAPLSGPATVGLIAAYNALARLWRYRSEITNFKENFRYLVDVVVVCLGLC